MRQKAVINSCFVLVILLLNSCEREWDNPWDANASLNPKDWAPQNLQIEDVSITEKRLTWNYGDHNIEGFKIDRKKGNDPWQVAYKELSPEARSWSDPEIVPDLDITYSYKLYAYAGEYISSDIENQVAVAIPPPSDLQTEELSDISYRLTWTDNSTGEQGFKIDRRIDNTNWEMAYGTVNADLTSFIDTNVFRSINVEYKVYAFYEAYESSKTSTNTNAALTPPSNLQITENSLTSATLTWHDNSEGEEGFRIERKHEGGGWEQIATSKNNSYEDNDFDLNTQVYYRISSYVGEHHSDHIESSFDSAIPAPTNLEITSNSITSITLSWQDNSSGEEGFRIERKYEGGNWEQIATVQNSTYDDEDFELNTQVYYRIYAFFGEYSSSYAENDFDSTIPPPMNLDITINSLTSVTLNWQYSHTGHDGFKIDRQINEGNWENDFAIVNSGQTTFTDVGVNLNENDYHYRLYVFWEQYNSSNISAAVLQLPEIGEIYAGGIVFYLENFTGGLVCAENDLSSGVEWGCYGTLIGGTENAIGAGKSNTASIISVCSDTWIAAKLCDEIVLNGYDDWFLPSKDELNLMYENLHLEGIGGFIGNYWWSSSEYNSHNAWRQSFYNGSKDYHSKSYIHGRVRAVRAFGSMKKK